MFKNQLSRFKKKSLDFYSIFGVLCVNTTTHSQLTTEFRSWEKIRTVSYYELVRVSWLNVLLDF